MDDNQEQPESLLPYDEWTEEALRQVVVRALQHVAANGLPGEHHFYLTFRTDHPGAVVPPRLRSQYPEEMTIVLQHQFWNLQVDQEAGLITVGLSFGGVPATLAIPLDAVVGFADPHVRYGLRFQAGRADASEGEAAESEAKPQAEPEPQPEAPEPPPSAPQVVNLDAFRRRGPSKDET